MLISVIAIAFPLAWMLMFLAPVLPIVARSELYLYLPVFGNVPAGGSAWRVHALRCLHDIAQRRIALVVFVIAIGVYQVTRAAAMHRDLEFSARFIDEARVDPDVAARQEADRGRSRRPGHRAASSRCDWRVSVRRAAPGVSRRSRHG
jgi:hypothetical protein